MTTARDIYLRRVCRDDCSVIAAAFAAQNWNKPAEQFERYLDECANGKRDILLAEVNGKFAGYVTIDWQPEYAFFNERSIPEIADLNVLFKFQRRGVGTRLIDAAEQLISERSDVAGIRVGLTADYGNAQRLYINADISGTAAEFRSVGKFLRYGDIVTVDDDLTIGFTRSLK